MMVLTLPRMSAEGVDLGEVATKYLDSLPDSGKDTTVGKGDATVEPKTDLQFVVDFDHHSDEAKQSSEGWNELRRGCPVAWNPRYGGYWMVTDYDNASRVSREVET